MWSKGKNSAACFAGPGNALFGDVPKIYPNDLTAIGP